MSSLEARVRASPDFSAKFELGSLIGAGGMGCVFQATQRSLNRAVAVKFLSDNLAADSDYRERFRREAIMAARMSHTNLVGVYDHGEVADRPYIVFEYVAGMSLRERIDEGPVTTREALEIALQICEGLRYAHTAGVVHRDIKPENLLVMPDGTVKIADFGVARDLETDLRATQPGFIVGTPMYLSPEQIEGRRGTPPSDLYALGIVLYEMLLGRTPFDPESPDGLMRQKLTERPSRADLIDPRIPARVGALVATAMEQDPKVRFTSAAAMLTALRKASALPGLVAEAPAPSPRPRQAVEARGIVRTRVSRGGRRPGTSVSAAPARTVPDGVWKIAVISSLLSVLGTLAVLGLFLAFQREGGPPETGPPPEVVVLPAGDPGADSVSPSPSESLSGPATEMLATTAAPRHVAQGPPSAPPMPMAASSSLPRREPSPARDGPVLASIFQAGVDTSRDEGRQGPARQQSMSGTADLRDRESWRQDRGQSSATRPGLSRASEERRPGESGLGWFRRRPQNPEALQAALRERQNWHEIRAILAPRLEYSSRAALFLACLERQMANTASTVAYLGRVMHLEPEGFPPGTPVRQLHASVSTWVVYLSLVRRPHPDRKATGLARMLEAGAIRLARGDSVRAAEHYVNLGYAGMPTEALWLPRSIALLGSEDPIGAGLNARLSAETAEIPGARTASLGILVQALKRMGKPELAVPYWKQLSRSSPPPPHLARLVRLREAMEEEPAAPEKSFFGGSQVEYLMSNEQLNRQDWLDRGWPVVLYDKILGTGGKVVDAERQLKPMLIRFLAGR